MIRPESNILSEKELEIDESKDSTSEQLEVLSIMSVAIVYILRCSDGSYYVGCTQDLVRRLKDHQNGIAADYTMRRRLVELVYEQSYDILVTARRRERQIKGWNRQKKEMLIQRKWK